MPITFSYADKFLVYKPKRLLKRYLFLLAKSEGWEVAALNYVFCTDSYLLDINQRFLQHDDYTDIITFDLGPSNDKAITGEVYISIDRVLDNAAKYSTPFAKELERVVFHGLLHLCGYADKVPAQIKRMRAAEDRHLLLFDQFKDANCST